MNKHTKMSEQGGNALLVIDVQQGLFEKSTPIYKAKELLDNIHSLVKRAHQQGTPVIYIQHSDAKNLVKGSKEWQLHPELQPMSIDYRVHKQHGNAFEDTNLAEILSKLNVTNLVLCGLVTHGCVRATTLGALDLGYRVFLAKDTHSSYSKDAAKLIEEWNEKLGTKGALLRASVEIDFEG